jgi:putative SOS response-associated peptidase YedK
MCGRYTQMATWAELVEYFNLVGAQPAEVTPRYNIAPSQSVLAIGPDRNGHLAAAMFQWGFIPSWITDKDTAHAPINARVEGVEGKPTFSDALRHRRCLIPATGWYEWKRLKGRKQPYYFRMKDGKPFAFAGLWEPWRSEPGAKPLLTCCLFTVPPNELAKTVHNRMPGIIHPSDYAVWMDQKTDDPEEVLPLVGPYEAERMEAFAVSTYVNDAHHDGPECVAPLPD